MGKHSGGFMIIRWLVSWFVHIFVYIIGLKLKILGIFTMQYTKDNFHAGWVATRKKWVTTYMKWHWTLNSENLGVQGGGKGEWQRVVTGDRNVFRRMVWQNNFGRGGVARKFLGFWLGANNMFWGWGENILKLIRAGW